MSEPENFKIVRHESHLGITHSIQGKNADGKWIIVTALPYWHHARGETFISRGELLL